MDKIKITKEHEEMLERVKENYSYEGAIQTFVDDKGTPRELRNYFNLNKFALLLCGWYEVEETLKKGDWVVHKDSGSVGVVVVNPFGGFDVKAYRQGFSLNSHDFRKAKPEEIAQEKERRKWSEIGRESGSYRKGDIVRFDNSLWEFSENGDQLVLIENGEGDEKDYKQAYAHEIELIVPVEQRFDKEES